MSKLERKFGKYAIKNLSLILIICYAFGYLFSMNSKLFPVFEFLTLNPALILRGQVWRLISWVIVPPSSFSIATLITLFFYYSIGHSLERAWGDWAYNVYIFSGFLFTIISSFVIFLIVYLKIGDFALASESMQMFSYDFSTYYVNMSIFLAFAATFPDAQVLLYFIIPIRVKWLGYIYAGLLIYEFLVSDWILKIVIIASLLNFILFFFTEKSKRFGSPRMRMHQAVRRREFNKDIKRESKPVGYNVSKHKCAICGRTELDNPNLEFRFCSKCNGNYEYCSEHLFTHRHIE